jgi:hypothetical protein
MNGKGQFSCCCSCSHFPFSRKPCDDGLDSAFASLIIIIISKLFYWIWI